MLTFKSLLDLVTPTTKSKLQHFNPEFVENFMRSLSNIPYPNFVLKELRKFYKFTGGLTHNSIKFWIERGWDDINARKKVAEFRKNFPPTKSRFNYKSYLDEINPQTGSFYTESEARFAANSIRPIKPEYWQLRGFDLESAQDKARDHKNKNNKRGAEESTKLTRGASDMSVRCTGYWMKLGFSEEAAKSEVSKIQSTFSLEKCIIKHGVEVGHQIWQARQDKWMDTLLSKPEEDLLDIYKRRGLTVNAFVSKYGTEIGVQKYHARIIGLTKFIPSTDDIFHDAFWDLKIYGNNKSTLDSISETWFHYYGLDKESAICEYWGISILDEPVRTPNIEPAVMFGSIIRESYNGVNYTFRSMLEYKFFRMLVGMNEPFVYDKSYPTSNKRYDFFLPNRNLYVELCGLDNESYVENVKYKELKLNAVLLWDSHDIMYFFRMLNADYS